MKKIVLKKILRNIFTLILTTYFLSLGYLSINTFVVAAPISSVDNLVPLGNPTPYNTLEEFLNQAVLPNLRLVIILIFSGVIIYGGFLRVTAQGNDQQVEKSSKTIIAGITGFAIVILAQPITDIVGKLLGVQGGLFTSK